jgi:hypothetical protein
MFSEHSPGVRSSARIAVLLALAACGGSQPALKPAPGAQAAEQLEQAARTEAAGVSVVAQLGAGPAGEEIGGATPARVILENRGQQPVRIQYRQFSLVTGADQQYAALPPFQISQALVMPMAVLPNAPIRPEWRGEKFAVARAYAPLYEGAKTVEAPLDYDVAYYNEHYRSWGAGEPPSDTMLKHALPEGILQPGGRLDGYLYYQKLPEGVQRAELRAEIVDASTGQVMETLRIPFTAND